MKSDTASECDVQTVWLKDDLTITGVGKIKARLAGALAGGGDTVIRIGSFEGIDLTCLQLICAFHRAAVSKEQNIRLDDDASDEFKTFIKKAGFERHQGCRFNPTTNCLWFKEKDNGKNHHDGG